MNKILAVFEICILALLLGWILAGWAIVLTIGILYPSSNWAALLMIWWVASWAVFITMAFIFDLREKKKKKEE